MYVFQDIIIDSAKFLNELKKVWLEIYKEI